MLHTRRLSCMALDSSPALLWVHHSDFLIDKIAGYRLQTDWNHRHFNNATKCFFASPSIQSNHIHKLQNVSTTHLLHFSTMTGTILFQARDLGKLSEEIENAIDEHRLNDAWNLHEQHMHIEGFPRKAIVNKLLTACAETLELHWLENAYGLVERGMKERKHKLFEKETLIFLCLGLARGGLPAPASTLLRKLVEMELYPPVSAWIAVLGHMSKTTAGDYLAAELVLEIGYLFQYKRVDSRKKVNAPLLSMKPSTTSFSIALAGCLLFGTTRKAEQLLNMMPRINVKPDATLLIIMAHVYEKNCRREELKKLKRHIDEAYNIREDQFRQYFNCLLSCHLKFGDLESASHMILEMLRKVKQAQNSLAIASLALEAPEDANSSLLKSDRDNMELGESEKFILIGSMPLSSENFFRDQKFSQLELEAKSLLDSLIAKLHRQIELVSSDRGVLQPTEMIYVKLVKAFLEAGRTKELAEFLMKAEKEDSPVSIDSSAVVNVINACISVGWLDQTHDLLDEMRLAGVRTGSSVYASLLKAYCKEKKSAEVAALLKDAQRAGVQLDGSCYDALIQSRVLEKDVLGALSLFKEMKEAKIPRAPHQEFDMLVKGCAENHDAGLMPKLLHEIKEGQQIDYGVHDWNNVLHFFCKKRLMKDAEKALKKMRCLGFSPNVQAFHSLVTGYAAVGGKYIEVTELWGEMKELAFLSGMKFDQELLDAVLYTFVRGGFFIRGNEVIEMMEKGKMFVDKYKYRTLFLKYHKTLYKGKVPKFQTESLLKKREAVLTFKKWVGLS